MENRYRRIRKTKRKVHTVHARTKLFFSYRGTYVGTNNKCREMRNEMPKVLREGEARHDAGDLIVRAD